MNEIKRKVIVNHIIFSTKLLEYKFCELWNQTIKCMVAYFCHYLSYKYVDLSDLYVDLSAFYVDLSDHYIDLAEKYHHNS